MPRMPTMERPPIIGFLTDFGLDGAAATCRGVMLSICPNAQVIDISHTIAKYAIRDGAFVLRSALPYLPVGAHVGVVDPGVGTARRPIAIRTGRGDVLVGPDNGLLVPAAEALGGISAARELTEREFWLPVTSSTFHGRDIFAPVAAHLAAGSATIASLGPELGVETLARLTEARAVASDGVIETEVIYVDSFGNVRLAGGADELRAAFDEVEPGGRFEIRIGEPDATPDVAVFGPNFGAIALGSTLLYLDSSGNLALADNQRSLAQRRSASTGLAVRIVRATT
jgi:S-adenosylmethionine hydrolase